MLQPIKVGGKGSRRQSCYKKKYIAVYTIGRPYSYLNALIGACGCLTLSESTSSGLAPKFIYTCRVNSCFKVFIIENIQLLLFVTLTRTLV